MTSPIPIARPDTEQPPARVDRRYLLLQGSTPVYIDSAGGRWLENLWAIDAREHTSYIANLTIASPAIAIDRASAQMVSVESDPLLSRIRFIPLEKSRSRLHALFQLPGTVGRLWKAIGQADIVHLGIAGWPYPLGWLGLPIAKLRKKTTIVVVESAPWRTGPGRHSVGKRAQSKVYESLGRSIVRKCDLKFFTTTNYLESLCGEASRDAHVVQASWIPAKQVIDTGSLELRMAPADTATRAVRIAFFGRLTEEKGVLLLLEAARTVGNTGLHEIDIYGDGPARDALQAAIDSEPALAALRMCGTVSYGEELFGRLADYDYVIVPSLGDEQPRIVYDAYSQGVPVIAADTSGLRQCVQQDETGLFFERGSVESLAALLQQISSTQRRRQRLDMARNSVKVAKDMTHAAMHATRARLIARHIDAG